MVLNVSEYHERVQNDATVGTHTQPNSQSDASSNVGDKMSDFDPTQCVMFFDIDNCLYHRNSGIEQFMKDRIYEYGKSIGISHESVVELTHRYTKDYGLAVRGLILHHEIDPVDYDKKVDQSLPIEKLIKKDPKLREMISRCKARRWAYTNAMLPHATRVLKTLGVYDLFEEIVYCDYTEPNFTCKPDSKSFKRTMERAGISDPKKCYLVDDSVKNIVGAQKMGWNTVLLSLQTPDTSIDLDIGHHQGSRIDEIYDLPKAIPELF